jgi:hypothetical protein
MRYMSVILWALICIPSALAQQATQEFDVVGSDPWLDTKIDVRAQDEIKITAAGTLTIERNQQVTPAGAKRGFRDMIRTYPVNDAGMGALIARIGDNASARAFLVGKELTWRAQRPGRLFLGINKSGKDAPKGSYRATLTMVQRAPEVTERDYKLPRIDTAVIDRYPRRIQDEQGNLGDNTNFIVVGNEKQVVRAFMAAGWVEVDRSHGDAVTAGIQAILSRKAYVSLPMSELTLFGRVQDHGLAQGDPIQVIAERHHFRIWKAPFQVDGAEFFVGAGTHDIGFDRDARNNGITHKIDPEIDKERDYIGMSLKESGLVAKTEYVTPSQPSKEAITATGATFKSDGRILVIYLIPENPLGSPPPTVAPPKNGSSIFDAVPENR